MGDDVVAAETAPTGRGLNQRAVDRQGRGGNDEGADGFCTSRAVTGFGQLFYLALVVL